MIKIYKYGEVENSELFARVNPTANVSDVVSEIIATVVKNGDKALFDYAERFDKACLRSLEVTAEEIDEAFSLVDEKFIEILKEALWNITDFHSRQWRGSFIINEKDGVISGQKVIPIQKVGLYVPGGTAAYPSTVLMDSVPDRKSVV